MSERTWPTTEQVRTDYATWPTTSSAVEVKPEYLEEFDRWIVAHDAEVLRARSRELLKLDAEWQMLRARAERAEGRCDQLAAALRDLADHGLRADLTPTTDGSSVQAAITHLYGYLRDLDKAVRDHARRALDGAGS